MKTIAPFIVIDPRVRFGKPVVKGTRVAVETILAEIAGGMAPMDVAREYRLTRRQVAAAIRYALRRLEEERHVTVWSRGMRVLLDEDLPRAFADVFERLGYEVFSVHELQIRGASDTVVFRTAQRLQAILVSADLGFANAVQFPPRSHHGILILRFPNALSISSRCEELHRLLRRFPPRQLHRKLTIVAPNLIRIRR